MRTDWNTWEMSGRRVVGWLTKLTLLLLVAPCVHAGVKLGADLLLEKRLDLLKGKRVGIVTNQSGRLSNGELLVDALRDCDIDVVALFGPEHGVGGIARAGESVRDTVDAQTGIPLFSLYGNIRKPTPEMLANVDLLIYHIQDVGARFYTYISTMALAMEAAADKGIPFIVLDRPNPLGGLMVDGPVMEDSLSSFVGMFPLPVVYGLTCGELARMINEEGWLAQGKHAELLVIPMEHWTRRMLWEDTGLTWYPPSPNIPTPASALAYPATCMIESTNLSEGRGTVAPFQFIGAPFLDGSALTSALDQCQLPGVRFQPATFVPSTSKFAGDTCHGIYFEVRESDVYRPTLTGLSLIRETRRLGPSEFRIVRKSFYRLVGSASVLDALSQGDSPVEIESRWLPRTEVFQARALRYHLYPVD
jgi:uncharacterized protein YbbC (DUF1343 family)